MLWGLLVILLVFPGLPKPRRDQRVQAWARDMLNRLGVELIVQGKPPATGPVLLVANHISWLDIIVMHAARHCRFIAKSDVRRWPLIGTLATGAGTLYVERESRRGAMRVVHRMTQELRNGEVLAIFPEGTTSDGRELLPFHGNLIQAAISTDTPVQPVALQFIDGRTGATCTTAGYLGDQSLVGSIWRTLGEPQLRARVAFGAVEHAQGRDRRTWARDLRASIGVMRESPMLD
jgi:1-acyl-sn-glycerol-3-phosphate acyltransferase